MRKQTKQKKIEYDIFDTLPDVMKFLNKIGREKIIQIVVKENYWLEERSLGGCRLEGDEQWIVIYEE